MGGQALLGLVGRVAGRTRERTLVLVDVGNVNLKNVDYGYDVFLINSVIKIIGIFQILVLCPHIIFSLLNTRVNLTFPYEQHI